MLTIGKHNVTKGSNDTEHLGRPAGLVVDPQANELYVADGYTNKRVIVMDADTGAYRRHWGAYGNKPDYARLPPGRSGSAPRRNSRTGPVHGITLSRDGLVYVTDRSGNRIQVFRKSGEFVKEGFVSRKTLDAGAAYGVALSTDPQQRWAYVNDGSNNKIWILRRDTLETVGSFGSTGGLAGRCSRPTAWPSITKGTCMWERRRAGACSASS